MTPASRYARRKARSTWWRVSLSPPPAVHRYSPAAAAHSSESSCRTSAPIGLPSVLDAFDAGKAGIYTISVAEAVGVMEETLNQ